MAKITRLTLLRHAPVNGPAALYGKTDIGVTAANNAPLLTTLIKHQALFDKVVSSPLTRCAGLATEFAIKTSKPLEISDKLQEMDFGIFDGIPFDELQKHWPSLEAFWQSPATSPLPEAESLPHFYQRVSQSIAAILSNEANQSILCISHGGVIRMILAWALQWDWQKGSLFSQLNIANGSLTHLEYHHQTGQCRVNGISVPIDYLTDDKQ